MAIETILFDRLLIDAAFQSRVAINPAVVSDYASMIKEGRQLPPIQVVKTVTEWIVVDGFHRIQAYRSIGRDRIEVRVIDGDRNLAMELAVGANFDHGLQRSPRDKVRAVEMALSNEVLSQRSDREIAALTNTSHPFVAKIRGQVGLSKSQSKYARKATPKQPVEVETFPPQGEEEPSLPEMQSELIEILSRDNEKLEDRLAVECMEATEEEKALAAQTIAELRERIRVLEIEVAAVKTSRDTYQNENAALKGQCARLQKAIKMLNNQIVVNKTAPSLIHFE